MTTAEAVQAVKAARTERLRLNIERRRDGRARDFARRQARQRKAIERHAWGATPQDAGGADVR